MSTEPTPQPQTLEDVLIQQTLFNAIAMRLRQRGFGEEQIIPLLQNTAEDLCDKLTDTIDDLIEPLLVTEGAELVPEDERWMAPIANRAVEENLDESGSPIYNSAQNYAVAMSAIRIVFEQRGRFLGVIDPEETLAPDVETQEKQKAILDGALKLFRVRYDQGRGINDASETALLFIAEKLGYVDMESMGVDNHEFEIIKTRFARMVLNLERKESS